MHSSHTQLEKTNMTSPKQNIPISILLLLLFFVYSSAFDMSIISYDKTHKSSWRTDDEIMAMYESWLVKHGKEYNTLGEKEKRFEIFKDNLKYIDEHNNAAEKHTNYKLGLNQFSDLTNQEFQSTYLGFGTTNENSLFDDNIMVKSNRYAPKTGVKLPDSIDWREKVAVGPIRDQGNVGVAGHSQQLLSSKQ